MQNTTKWNWVWPWVSPEDLQMQKQWFFFVCLLISGTLHRTGISVWTILSVAEACVYAAHSMQIYSMHKYPNDLLHLPKCALVHEIFHPTMHSLLICNLTFHFYSYEQTKSNIRFLTSVSWLLDIQTHCQDIFGENWTTKTENVSKTRKWHLVTSSTVNVNVRCLETQRCRWFIQAAEVYTASTGVLSLRWVSHRPENSTQGRTVPNTLQVISLAHFSLVKYSRPALSSPYSHTSKNNITSLEHRALNLTLFKHMPQEN